MSKKVKVFTKKKKQGETEEIKTLQEKYESINTENITTFADLPLSAKTMKGLKATGYNKPTEIQRDTIGLSLQGKDILGAAKTGSGKTLAFIIPILEALYCKQWTRYDGVGAVVITPTRELAYQIFNSLRQVGQFHDFSAGLIIGGKDLKFERNRMDQCNIVICTPGRLLQHMDENPLFDCVNMQILILDEADRCLDMGFSDTMNAIIANLPPKRQTLLFSATQTKSVKDLARLSLKDPCYISVHEHAEHSTPSTLEQSYIVCKLEEKVSLIWSFIKNHLKQKIIIFFSTCHEVKYLYDIFCKLRPGTTLMALYGTLHQLRRMKIYEDFCKKQSAVLFATDLVARGLDFPEVHWVVQADCPEDADTYIHRVGRTARYYKNGESLLLLLPSELKLIDDLKNKRIPINKIDVNPNKLRNPVAKMKCYLFNEELKERAKRACISYGKSVYMMKNKDIFKLEELDLDAYALSLGLTIPPTNTFLLSRLRIIENKKKLLNNMKKMEDSGIEDSTKEGSSKDEEESDSDKNELSSVNSSQFKALRVIEDEDDLFGKSEHIVPKKIAFENKTNDEFPKENKQFIAPKSSKNHKPTTKVALVKKLLRQNKPLNKKIIFADEEEEETNDIETTNSKSGEEDGLSFNDFAEELIKDVKADKQIAHEKVKMKHREEKKKLKQKKKKDEPEEKDDFGTDSEDEGPDLSWLPDPDKIYGIKDDEDNEGDAEVPPKERSPSPQLEEPQIVLKSKKKSKKRKFAQEMQDTVEDKVERKKKKLEKASAKLGVSEAEELALMLLKNK